MDEEMDALERSNAEIKAVIEDKTASKELRTTVRRFFFMDPQAAKEDAQKLEELFARRLFACEEIEIIGKFEEDHPETYGPPSQEEIDRMIFAVGDGRLNYATERLIHFVELLERENVGPRILYVLLFALARTFISACANRTGVDQDLKDARFVFEDVLKSLGPMMREMPQFRR